MNSEPSEPETRQERRGRRLQKKRERMPQHGKSLAQVYKDAVLGRLRRARKIDKEGKA